MCDQLIPTAISAESDVDRKHRSTTRGTGLAHTLTELARRLQGLGGPDEVLTETVTAAVAFVPGSEHGSIAELRDHGRRVVHRAASSDLPMRMAALTQQVGQGPCWDAIRGGRVVRVDDLTDEHRWPQFSRRAAELGTRSVLSIQLYVDYHDLGALNLYSGRPGAFTDEAEDIGLVLAAHAAIAYADARRAANLQAALDTRGSIGRATGIVMERYQLGVDQAFAVLVRLSQQSNRKLHDVAAQIVESTQNGQRGLPSFEPVDPGDELASKRTGHRADRVSPARSDL